MVVKSIAYVIEVHKWIVLVAQSPQDTTMDTNKFNVRKSNLQCSIILPITSNPVQTGLE